MTDFSLRTGSMIEGEGEETGAAREMMGRRRVARRAAETEDSISEVTIIEGCEI